MNEHLKKKLLTFCFDTFKTAVLVEEYMDISYCMLFKTAVLVEEYMDIHCCML